MLHIKIVHVSGLHQREAAAFYFFSFTFHSLPTPFLLSAKESMQTLWWLSKLLI